MTSDEARRLAISLPGCEESPHFESASFRVNKKIFATMPPKGDVLHVFVDDTEREQALGLYAGMVEPLWWGKKVRGLRVLLGKASADVVLELLEKSWRHRAPKTAPVPTRRRR
jgi:hypothetical protein